MIMMKRILVRLAIVAFVATNAFAEGGILVGGGMSLSNFSGPEMNSGIKQKAKLGYTLDWSYWWNLNDRIGFSAGVAFETRGANFGIDTTTEHLDLFYFQIPLQVSYTIFHDIVPRFLSDFSVSAGPEIGILARSDDAVDGYKLLNGLDYGASGNLGITFCNRIVLRGGYYMGFSNILKTSDNYNETYFKTTKSIKNSAIRVILEYKYQVK
jgi:hypothetical protein